MLFSLDSGVEWIYKKACVTAKAGKYSPAFKLCSLNSLILYSEIVYLIEPHFFSKNDVGLT